MTSKTEVVFWAETKRRERDNGRIARRAVWVRSNFDTAANVRNPYKSLPRARAAALRQLMDVTWGIAHEARVVREVIVRKEQVVFTKVDKP